MSAIDKEAFPRGALLAAAGLVSFSLIATILGNHAGKFTPVAVATPSQTVSLQFADRADGAVQVVNAQTGQTLALLAPGGDGFVRSVMRGMAHDRMKRHIANGPGFRLQSWADGRVVLDDPATGRHIDLNAFGDINLKAFSRFLPNAGAAS